MMWWILILRRSAYPGTICIDRVGIFTGVPVPKAISWDHIHSHHRVICPPSPLVWQSSCGQLPPYTRPLVSKVASERDSGSIYSDVLLCKEYITGSAKTKKLGGCHRRTVCTRVVSTRHRKVQLAGPLGMKIIVAAMPATS